MTKLNPGDWEYYLARPFSLFGASLWHLWYSSDKTIKLFGRGIEASLLIEVDTNQGTVKKIN